MARRLGPSLFLAIATLTPAQELRVAAAADLAPLQQSLSAEFRKSTGIRIAFVTGSSGILARQIENGAPYDVYLSANEALVQDLARKGKVAPESVRTYATGRLGLWSARGDVKSLGDLADPSVRYIALPNPAHAPYGQAAKEALASLKLWDRVSAKIVYGENVRQSFEYAQSKNADAVITAWTIVKDRGGIAIDPSLHAPVRQAGGVVAGSTRKKDAQRFLDFLAGQAGQKILRDAGLGAP